MGLSGYWVVDVWRKALTALFSRLKRAGVTIRAVATDMSGGYVAAVMKHLWPTQLVFDRFHVVKLMNEKLSTLRRERYRELKDVQQRDVLKGVRWLLLKNPENLKQTPRGDERSRLAEALKLNEPLAQAYYLKDELRQFWRQNSKATGLSSPNWYERKHQRFHSTIPPQRNRIPNDHPSRNAACRNSYERPTAPLPRLPYPKRSFPRTNLAPLLRLSLMTARDRVLA
jgi:transposase